MDNMLEDMLHRESIEMSEPSHHVPHVHSLSGRSALVCTFIDVHPACSFLLVSHSCISCGSTNALVAAAFGDIHVTTRHSAKNSMS